MSSFSSNTHVRFLALNTFLVLHPVSGCSLLQLLNLFPLLSIFLDLLQLLSKCRCFFLSLLFVSSVSSGLTKSFISSSHLLFGRPTVLFVWYLVLRPGFHFAAFFVHHSSGNDAILTAKRHFILLCASTQHGFFAVFMLSTATDVLLLTYSIQSSSSISPVSISSSVSFVQEMSLSWSQSVLELLPSAVSSSELLWLALSSSSSSSFLLGWVFFLYFLVV